MVDVGPPGADDHAAPARHSPRSPAHRRRCGICQAAYLHTPGMRRDPGEVRLAEAAQRLAAAYSGLGDATAALPSPTLAAVTACLSGGVGLMVWSHSVVLFLAMWALAATILAGGFHADRKSRPANARSAEQPAPAAPADVRLDDPGWLRANGMPQTAAAVECLAALRPEGAAPPTLEREAFAEGQRVAAEVRTWRVPCLLCHRATHTVGRRGREIVVLPAAHHPMLRLIDGWEVRCLARGGSYTWRPTAGFDYRIAEPIDSVTFPPEEA